MEIGKNFVNVKDVEVHVLDLFQILCQLVIITKKNLNVKVLSFIAPSGGIFLNLLLNTKRFSHFNYLKKFLLNQSSEETSRN